MDKLGDKKRWIERILLTKYMLTLILTAKGLTTHVPVLIYSDNQNVVAQINVGLDAEGVGTSRC